ncbi:zinc-binding dehydrogenase [Desulfosporosinus hippei]|uniref:Alcohol dehydrogenase n=1 Tax=Desulfosporosinus hippei DSM 8344 TaxID=1121419 RepID=A0A1G8I3E3_9FIRM|nr:alcohol dehydrogenase catalytic domain-containing protein [Desulfosporosinus hippei]SDI13449.1 alcohol dehydrogenase [Desulfosporosinus hippei DSM 8344]
MEQKTMKALVYEGPDKYSLKDVPMPVISDPHDVIGRVTLGAICTSDIHTVKGELQNVHYPKTMGHECCLEVVEVGSKITHVKPGDLCIVNPGVACGKCLACKLGIVVACKNGGVFGSRGPLEGCHAEYVKIPYAHHKNGLIKIPEGLTEEDVILLPDMLATAWYGLKNADFKEGQTLAVIGVGPVGLSACVLAKKVFGAKQVIAVDILQNRVDMALNQGIADLGFNPNTDEVVKKIQEATGGLGVDVVLETPGLEETMAMSVAATRPSGIVSTIAVFSEPLVPMPLLDMILRNIQLKMGIQKSEGLEEMLEWIKDGKIDTKFMLTHRASLNDLEKGYKIFGDHEDGCVKWLITPYERPNI